MDAVRKHRSGNLILDLLPNEEFAEIEPKLSRIGTDVGDVLNQPQEKIERVWFPETCVISVVTLLENGTGVESGVVGREGVYGVSPVLTDREAFSEATIQLKGDCLVLKVADFRDLFERSREFRQIIHRYLHAFIGQISQNAACLSYHTIERRLARWLLMFHDRADSETMEMTQEFISQMLGVHRPSVSKSAHKLQDQGLIRYNRGRIEILDREGLEEFSCECYQTINRAHGRYTGF